MTFMYGKKKMENLSERGEDVISWALPSRKGMLARNKNNYYLAAVSVLTDRKEVHVTRKIMHCEHADKLQQMGSSWLEWGL